jgi:hypothetical protein
VAAAEAAGNLGGRLQLFGRVHPAVLGPGARNELRYGGLWETACVGDVPDGEQTAARLWDVS